MNEPLSLVDSSHDLSWSHISGSCENIRIFLCVLDTKEIRNNCNSFGRSKQAIQTSMKCVTNLDLTAVLDKDTVILDNDLDMKGTI